MAALVIQVIVFSMNAFTAGSIVCSCYSIQAIKFNRLILEFALLDNLRPQDIVLIQR
jgi:hypothetical protein